MIPNDDNPWKGLNFYVEGEVLYGRDTEIKTLAQYIINNSQTVLYGKSGIGKSSIINAGIFPIARQEGLIPIPMRLEHDSTDPSNYLKQIKRAFKESGIGMEPLHPAIDEQSETLWEFFHRHRFFHPETKAPVRPLVVFDQFEEFFTIQRNEATKKEFFSQLADLINEVTPQYIIDAQRTGKSKSADDSTNIQSSGFKLDLRLDMEHKDYAEESDFNLVFILREDFLSSFERYTAYIPAMKSNRFPLLPLNEEQAAEIILRPREGMISPQVAELIIQKVTGTTEFTLDGIPEIEVNATMLSLYLSRLYLKKGEQKTITADMVNQFGDYIIKDYYEESIADIPKDEIEKLEDALITYDGRRDNDSLINLKHKDEKGRAISDETIKKLVEERKLLRLFSYQGDQRLEFMHDTLCDTINKRIEQRQQEEETARIREEEEQRHKQETKRNRRRIKWLAFATAFLAAILLGAFIRHQLYEADYSLCYGNFYIENGWPKGLNPIEIKNNNNNNNFFSKAKDNPLDSIIVYYRLTRHGRLNRKPFYKVEVISAHDHQPTTNKFIESPAVGLWNAEFGEDKMAKAFAELQKQTVSWVYIESDQDPKIAGKCTAYGKDGKDNKELYSIQFNRDNTYKSSDESKYVQWAVYYDPSGKSMIINKNGIDRMRQSIDNGKVTKCMFYSMLGVPQNNERGAYGYEYNINDTTHQIREVYRMNKFGDKIDDKPLRYFKYKYGRPQKTSLYDVSYPERGLIVRHFKPDSIQKFNDTLAFYPNVKNYGKLKCGSLHPDINKDSILSFSYDEQGQPLFRQIRSRGKIVNSEIYAYLGGIDFNGDPKYREIKKIKIINDTDTVNYSELYEYPDDSTRIMKLMRGEKPFSLEGFNEQGDNIHYHSYIFNRSERTDSNYIIESKEYLDTNGKPVVRPNEEANINLYSKFEIYKNKKTDNIELKYYLSFDSIFNEYIIIKSEWFEYDDYGNKTAIAVAGVDKTPVRCPKWHWFGFCCYKMKFLEPFYKEKDVSNVYASIQGVNEFGENSMIVQGGKIITIEELPLGYFDDEKLDIGQPSSTGFNLSMMKETESKMNYSAFFIHILSTKGTFYSARLKDGDIIVRINGEKVNSKNATRLESDNDECHLEIARAINNNYVIKHFTVPAGERRIHVHHIEITKDEYNRLKEVL
jgi:hypothetical protein